VLGTGFCEFESLVAIYPCSLAAIRSRDRRRKRIRICCCFFADQVDSDNVPCGMERSTIVYDNEYIFRV